MSWKENIEKHFSNAAPGSEVTAKYIDKVENEFGGGKNKTLFATSLCVDDIRVTSTHFNEAFFGPFVLGGLGGLPFAGMTGMTAFSHHIPDDGTAFIFYGPHIGVTSDGVLGKMRRPGQSSVTSSCGALMLCLNRISNDEDGEPYIPVVSDEDYQQKTLERYIMPFKQRVTSAEMPEKEITDVTYHLIHQQVRRLVERLKPEFHCARIAMLGGVTINTDPDQEDWVDVRDWKVIELQ